MENIEELKKKYAELGKEIERLEQEKKNKRWRAKDGEFFYGVLGNLKISKNSHYTKYDEDLYNIGNYFKTEEEAQKVANKIKTYIELKQLAEELNGDEEIDWNDFFQNKYTIVLNTVDNKPAITQYAYTVTHPLTIYCLDENFADKAIEQIGEERLIELFEERS